MFDSVRIERPDWDVQFNFVPVVEDNKHALELIVLFRDNNGVAPDFMIPAESLATWERLCKTVQADRLCVPVLSFPEAEGMSWEVGRKDFEACYRKLRAALPGAQAWFAGIKARTVTTSTATH
jgi:hypothetical protein